MNGDHPVIVLEDRRVTLALKDDKVYKAQSAWCQQFICRASMDVQRILTMTALVAAAELRGGTVVGGLVETASEADVRGAVLGCGASSTESIPAVAAARCFPGCFDRDHKGGGDEDACSLELHVGSCLGVASESRCE